MTAPNLTEVTTRIGSHTRKIHLIPVPQSNVWRRPGTTALCGLAPKGGWTLYWSPAKLGQCEKCRGSVA